ncbi:hypothetical protein SELMODRAFT_440352 [Selaginella moellendorffii]|uniref:Histone deacetylase interacting domain-containing protein n=1 Tax=Selaginella moellendorffii TaxID=88036 RepID=D8RB70_SELML|nr:hypothetical protein SELMODRAFT_440352 [Selaginella moellendorffii]
MKRGREDSTSGPQLKRTAGESSEQPRLTTEDAMLYLKAVKEKFKDDNGKYAEFLEVMKDFKAQRIDTSGVIAKVKDLFKGHNKLILGFNTFLPKNYQIVLPEEKKQPVEFDQAINFVNKIKNRFNDNEHVYKAFLEILNKYRKGTKSINEVYDEVASLFRDHPDLLDEFTRFLPDTGNAVQTSFRQGTSNQRKEEKGPSGRSSQYPVIKKETERSSLKAEKEHRRKLERERDRNDEHERDRDKEDLDRDDLDGQRLPHKRKSARRADELIRKQSQTAEGTSTQIDYAFFEKVKGRLRNRDSYKELIKILNLYTEQIINRGELHSFATDILGKHPDLLEGFNNFLQCENAGLESEGVASKGRDKDHDREKDWEKDRDKDKERYASDKTGQKMSLLPSKDKFTNKPISELDLSNCETCTPSYRLLPKNYPRLPSNHRNELANSVLNDSWVSVTSGSEDSSFKHMRRNQYEESLFRCEDDRFELDMLLESTALTAKRVGELVEKLDSGQLDPSIRIDDYLSAINLRCIERIYGDHGLDIIDLMRKNASSVLAVVHCRLRQKEEEWAKCRADMNKVWAEVYTKNYHKSLDHRSFYFKQQDKKSLSSKGLLAEIKDVHEKKRKEDESVLHLIMGNKRLPTPDMKFGYPDSSIHEDLFQIMKYSADEVCNTMEQSDKIMRVWTMSLELLFGVPPRPRGTDDTEEAVRANCVSKEEQSSSGESAASGGTGSPANEGKNTQEECATASSRPVANSVVHDSRRKRKGEEGRHGDNAAMQREASLERKDGLDATEAKSSSRHEHELETTRNATSSHRTSAHGKGEREEGELSPETNEGKNVLRKDGSGDADADVDHNGDGGDEGEESGQKSSDDSENENASEAGEEVSGSDAGDPDGSRDDHDEDEEEDADEEHEQKVESECEGMADADNTDGDGISSPDRFSVFCKPLASHAGSLDAQKDSTVFYGNDMFYILFRLHQTFYERMHSAKTNSLAAEQKWKSLKDNTPPNLYAKFVRVLYDLLDGTADNAKFEDECRSIIGTQSYVLFTLDKLIYKLVKQLQAVAADETATKLLALYAYEKSRGPGGFYDPVYHANTCVLLHDESIYRFELDPNSTELSIQLMSGASEKLEVPASAMEFSFSNYLNGFLLTVPDAKAAKGVFLKRNKRSSPFNEDPQDVTTAMEGVRVLNGLEYKISCKTSKLRDAAERKDFATGSITEPRVYQTAKGKAREKNGMEIASASAIASEVKAMDVAMEEAAPLEQNQQLPAAPAIEIAISCSQSVLQERNKRFDDLDSVEASKKVAAAKPVVRVPPRMMFGSHPERYLSPTDSLVSPISRGLLWRNHRRPVRKLIPPVAPKALESAFLCANDENSRKLKQQAERKSGIAREPLLARSAEIFESALGQQALQQDRDECLFDLGDTCFLWAKSIATAVPSLATPLTGDTKKARAEVLKLEAFARAAPLFTKSFEIFDKIELSELKAEALTNSGSVLCELAEVLVELPETQGGGLGVAMKLCSDAYERYSAALSASPDDLDVHANMADCCIRQAELLAQGPSSWESWDRAKLLYDRALEVYEYVCSVADTKKGDDLSTLLENWAACLVSKAEHVPDYLEALELYGIACEKLCAATKLSPTRIALFTALGDSYIAEFERLPEEPPFFEKRYSTMLSAVESFTTALRINSSNIDALLGIAEAHRLASRSSRLLGNSRGSHDHSDQSTTYHMRCIELLKSGEHDIDFSRQCDVLYNLACVAVQCGREQDATAALKLLGQAEAVTAAELVDDPDFESSKSSAWFWSLVNSFPGVSGSLWLWGPNATRDKLHVGATLFFKLFEVLPGTSNVTVARRRRLLCLTLKKGTKISADYELSLYWIRSDWGVMDGMAQFDQSESVIYSQMGKTIEETNPEENACRIPVTLPHGNTGILLRAWFGLTGDINKEIVPKHHSNS